MKYSLRLWLILPVFAWAIAGLVSEPAMAQTQSLYTITFRSVELNEALAEFSQMTGKGVTFDPALIESKRATCAISQVDADAILRCMLEGTGLDYVQLSSGTYVIIPSSEQDAIYGTIAGDVRDLNSGYPLANAHVLLASTEKEISTVSNRNGQFTLPPLLPGRYYLSTTHLGYHDIVDTLIVIPGGHSFRNITMVEAPIVFTPVVIDGIQRKQSTESLDHSLLLLSDSLMLGQISTSGSVAQQVASVPGIRINDLTADAHLQGSDAGEHQFKLDGVPIFMPQRAIGILGPFSPFALQSITIHKTGFGVNEGSFLAGVVAAEHKLSAKKALDVQLDPLSVNARFLSALNFDPERKLELMGSVRSSLWDVYRHPQLESTLNNWSRPDPFLIFGPIKRYDEIGEGFFQEVLNVSAVPTTSVSFSDIHLAGNLSLTPFSALSFSGYSGSNNLKGFLPGIFSSPQDTLVLVGNESDSGARAASPAPLSVSDQYRWRNSAGQVNYHTLLGRHTLFNIQARASTYVLNQNYKLVDGLTDLIESSLPGTIDFTGDEPAYEFPIRQLEETNDVLEYALEGRLEHAFDTHFLSGGLELTRTESASDLLLPSLVPDILNQRDTTFGLAAGLERIAYQSRVNRSAAFIQDRFDLNKHFTAEIGARLTYFFANNKAYAEPRMSIRYDGRMKNGASFAARTAAGVFRQYLLQFDVSTLNAGTLFPSKRIWIPVDDHVLPPLAYHFSQSFLFAPSEALTFRMEGYAKLLHETFTINYIPSPSSRVAFNLETAYSSTGNDFIAPASSTNLGASFSMEWALGPVYSHFIYDFSSIRRKSPDLFENNQTTVPWNEPHRLSVAVQTQLLQGLMFSARFTGVWGRSWGFRQAYYDFFGHRSATRLQPPFDFGNPEDDVLPAIYQMDLGLAYNIAMQNTTLQFRIDLINALDRKNVADWRLIWVDGKLRKDNRYLYPRIPSFALRLSL